MVIFWPALAAGFIGAVVGHYLWRELHTVRFRLRRQGAFYIAEAWSWRTGAVRASATERPIAINRALDEIKAKGFPMGKILRVLADGKKVYP